MGGGGKGQSAPASTQTVVDTTQDVVESIVPTYEEPREPAASAARNTAQSVTRRGSGTMGNILTDPLGLGGGATSTILLG